MNRGSDEASQPEAATPEASMRPRFMNRGSYDLGMDKYQVQIGFNEAPIHESGKSAFQRRQGFQGFRFNEAPIHESGKFRGRDAAHPRP